MCASSNYTWRFKQRLRLIGLLAVFVYVMQNYSTIFSYLTSSPFKCDHGYYIRPPTPVMQQSLSEVGKRWGKLQCAASSQFSFCTKSRPYVENPLLSVYPPHPNGVGPCKTAVSVCLKIVFTVEDAVECEQQASGIFNFTCLALFMQMQTSKMFFDQFTQKSFQNIYISVAATSFPSKMFRRGYDLLLPVDYTVFAGEDSISHFSSVPILPARRQFLLSFSAGHFRNEYLPDIQFLNDLRQLSSKHLSVDQRRPYLMHINIFQNTEEIKNCWTDKNLDYSLLLGSSWYPCSDLPMILANSTFGLVIQTEEYADPLGWQTQLAECLATGAVPVLVGDGPLPGDEAITQSQWSKAIIHAAVPNAKRLLDILNSMTDQEIIEMRRECRTIFNRYFIDENARISTLLLALSRRLHYKPPMAPVTKAKLLYVGMSENETLHRPEKKPFPNLELSSRVNDDRVYPFWSYTSTPWDTVLPTDVFLNKSNFEEWIYERELGYDYPKEEITAIVLVYNRLQSAYDAVKCLDKIKYLNSVIVIYNNPNGTLENMSWPTIHVPIYVIQPKRNSLNNRFLPYDLIKTDAVLSLDDDCRPDQSSILETFRLWRSNRDRLVGYVARNHVPVNGSWRYAAGSRHHYSMILTGITIFHRYYLYAYTYEMPAEIREFVDRHMNCEDIAMNFLVAHLSRKSPLLTSTRSRFAPSGRQSALSFRPGHYFIRSQCLNRLKEIYGYTPLIYTTMKGRTIFY